VFVGGLGVPMIVTEIRARWRDRRAGRRAT
jgi:hypothetical protein